MPYPHSNSDGKATLGHDEKGMPLPAPSIPDYWHPSSGKTIASFHQAMEAEMEAIKKQLVKDQLIWGKVNPNLEPKPGEFGKPTGQSVKDLDKLLKDTYAKPQYVNFHIHKGAPPPDPVLIPATEKYSNLWKPLYHGEIPKPVPIKALELDVYVGGIPLQAKKVGLRIPINTHQDYTESDVRKMLEDSFRKITDHIIEGMKGNKK